MSLALLGVSELPHICFDHGIKHAVISSGSRCAPLILSFVSHGGIKCESIIDERSAAYYALGMAQQLQKPVVLICTSGTAVANYLPAAIEAFYLKVPLLILTADRPAEWIDQNDGQTIRQQNIFSNGVKKSYQLPVETEKDNDLWFFRRTVNEAIGYCTLDNPGPVHINIPLKEPLYNPLLDVDSIPVSFEICDSYRDLSSETWNQIIDQWKTFEKKLIVCGLSSSKNLELQNLLNQLTANQEAVVIAENISNIVGNDFISSPEQFIASLSDDQLVDFWPDLLITIGDSVVSKRLKKYIRQYRPTNHWHIDENELFIDTFQSLSLSVRTKPERFFSKVLDIGPQNSTYTSFAKNQLKSIEIRLNEFMQSAEFCDLTAWFTVYNNLPSNINLHLANSTPVRYAQLFNSRNDISYFSNRGTSGIDGCVSTAAGAALVSDKLNVLFVGDMSFIYDSNALWNNNLPSNLRIVVMDNEGGNIFRLIESGPEVDKILPFIEKSSKVKIKDLCSAFGVDYQLANNLSTLNQELKRFFSVGEQPKILHITTSAEKSVQAFKNYFQYIKHK
jgi:2-succinyl-5-enolpyruvyl-6-hydroxy-3-cyclohexene-1-carboxylate synthase